MNGHDRSTISFEVHGMLEINRKISNVRNENPRWLSTCMRMVLDFQQHIIPYIVTKKERNHELHCSQTEMA